MIAETKVAAAEMRATPIYGGISAIGSLRFLEPKT